MYSDNLTQKVAQAAAKIMDEELKGNQHKIDANKNGKIDAEDFKLLKKKPVNEVADEDYAAQNVYDKAHMAHMSKNKNIPADKQQAAELEAHKHALETLKMKYPHHTASRGEGQVSRLSKEESEQIDELSKDTLGNYVKRATNQAIVKSLANPSDKSDDMKTIDKREKGVRLAVSKLTKEDQEFIHELNKSTLGSYVNASARDAVYRTAKEVETGRLDKMADKRMKGIKLATKKLAKEETDQVEEGYYKDIDTNRKEDERLAKKDSSPFGKPDKKKTKIATAGKFGYGYSAARHLARQGMAGMNKEETEQVEEDIQKTSTGYIHHARPGVYGGSEKEKHVVDTLRGPKKSELNAIEKEKKMKKFSEMVELYNEIGLKSLSTMISEEPDNETFTKELKDQEAKAAGKKKQADIAKGSVQAVKVEEVELTEDEAQILDSLSQEEFNSLTEEEQDLFIEYFQPLDEISTGAAKNYLKKAVSSSSKLNQKAAKPGEAEGEKYNYSHENAPYETKQFEKFSKRRTGIRKAITKLASAHPDNKKLATTARQAFNKMHNANYRIGMDGAKNTPDDVKHVKQQHAIIHKAVHAMKEYVEQLDELSPKTLGSYVKKAHRSGTDNSFDHGDDEHRQYGDPDDTEREKEMQDRERAIANREKGVHRAVKRLTKEEQVEERSLTEPEMKKKEEIVKSMKKGLSGFKARYGKDAKSVMYATATKQAKK